LDATLRVLTEKLSPFFVQNAAGKLWRRSAIRISRRRKQLKTRRELVKMFGPVTFWGDDQRCSSNLMLVG
jgi:hypothetical protein